MSRQKISQWILEQGYNTLRSRTRFQLQLARSGLWKMTGVIAALIATGKNSEEAIHEAIADLYGTRWDYQVDQILTEHEGTDPEIHLWYRMPNGNFAPTGHWPER